MSNNIYSKLFSKEVTCLPSIIDKYFSKYYNNALGNAISWGFFFWFLLHYFFDKFLNMVLKQMKYPEYLRIRIIASLWNFGFCAGSFIYCYATLSRNNLEFMNISTKLFTSNSDVIPGQFIFGFVVFSTYYAQNAFWETTKNCDLLVCFEYCLIFLFAILTYINNCVEILFATIYVNNLIQCFLELSRTFSFQFYNKTCMNFIASIYFVMHTFLSFCLYMVLYPLFILMPLAKLILIKLSPEFILLNLIIWMWFTLNICNSVIAKLVKHYVWHKSDIENVCTKSYIQCSLFPPRTDAAFNLKLIKKEIEEANSSLIVQKKKPNAALGQIIKCAVSFQKKVKARRAAKLKELSDADIIAKSILDEIINNIIPSEISDEVNEVENISDQIADESGDKN